MRRGWVFGAFLAAGVVVAATAFRPVDVAGEDGAAPGYVGVGKCKACHPKQNKSWAATPMSKAIEVLKIDAAADKKTAAKLDPKVDYSKDAKCLKCHTTGYGTATGYPAVVEGTAWTEAETARAEITAGVTCEACHGPGSAYSAYKKTPEGKKYKRSDVVKLGLTTPPKAEQCQVCHEKGGCPTMAADYKFDFEEAKKKTDKVHESLPLKENHDG